MITDEQLKALGFERQMTDYWKKGEFGVLRSWKEGKGTLIHHNVLMDTVEELKEAYLKRTGEELE
jgi:hypothetical protein